MKKTELKKKLKNAQWKIIIIAAGIGALLLASVASGHWSWFTNDTNKKDVAAKQPVINDFAMPKVQADSNDQPATTPAAPTNSASAVTPKPTTTPKTTAIPTLKTAIPTAAAPKTTVIPSPPAFRVSSVSVSVSPTQGPAYCDHSPTYPFTFTGTITTTSAGTVHYHWGRSDGGTTPDTTIVFSSAESKQVTTDWITFPTESGSKMDTLIVTSPNAISNQASFIKIFCPLY